MTFVVDRDICNGLVWPMDEWYLGFSAGKLLVACCLHCVNWL